MQSVIAFAQLRDEMVGPTENITVFESIDDLEDYNFDNKIDSACIKGG